MVKSLAALAALLTVAVIPPTRQYTPGRDSGRVAVSLTAFQVAGVASDTLLSVTKVVNGVSTTAQTNYTPTSGSTLRCTAISICQRSGAAAASWSVLNLRYNPAGATTASSPLVATIEAEDAAAAAGNGSCAFMDFPDGIEMKGDGTGTIGLSHVSSATTNVETVTAYCFEYH